jgi:hypothetical protein
VNPGDVGQPLWEPPYFDEIAAIPAQQAAADNPEWAAWLATLDPATRARPVADVRTLARGPGHERRIMRRITVGVACTLTAGLVAVGVIVARQDDSTATSSPPAADDDLVRIPGASRFVGPDGSWSADFVGQPTSTTATVRTIASKLYTTYGAGGDVMSASRTDEGDMGFADIDVIAVLKSPNSGLIDVVATPTTVAGEHAVAYIGVHRIGSTTFEEHGLLTAHGGHLLTFTYEDLNGDNADQAAAFLASVRLIDA